ncbi:MAG: glycine cleavage system protein GcvH, partial [Kiloniellales bacterium]|nr:glycine cleavage system protein GcvH [Kiloniellales bacterium]
MSKLLFSEEHEWILVEDDIATIGITDHAQEQLGEVVYVETPEIGSALAKGDEAGVVESVKAASEVYSPISGEVVEANEDLADSPQKVNEDAMGDGWFFKMTVGDAGELEDLMDEAAYKDF